MFEDTRRPLCARKGDTSEVITPDHSYVRLYKRKVTSHKVGSWLHDVWSRRASWWCVVETSRGRGVVDMRKIRVLRLCKSGFGGRLPGGSRWTCPGERVGYSHIVWGGWCCPAERGSKALGSKYLPRRGPPERTESRASVRVSIPANRLLQRTSTVTEVPAPARSPATRIVPRR